MNSIIIYSEDNYNGISRTIMNQKKLEIKIMDPYGFKNGIKSLQFKGNGTLTLYPEIDFNGIPTFIIGNGKLINLNYLIYICKSLKFINNKENESCIII